MDMTGYACRGVRRETASTNYERSIRLDRLKERVVGEPGAFCRRELPKQTRLCLLRKELRMALRFRKAGKALLSMYPGEGSFTVQIVLGETPASKASSPRLGKNAKNVLESARQFPEGRWLFIRVSSKQDIRDIQQLLLLKTSGPQI